MTGQRPELGKAQEVADYLGIKLVTLYQWRLNQKGPPACKVGRELRYRWEDVDSWLAARFNEDAEAQARAREAVEGRPRRSGAQLSPDSQAS